MTNIQRKINAIVFGVEDEEVYASDYVWACSPYVVAVCVVLFTGLVTL